MANAIVVAEAACNGCGTCAKTCPQIVFEQPAPKAKPVVAHRERCIGCLACEEDCARGALRVHRLPEGLAEGDVPAPAAGLDGDRTYDLVVVGGGPAGLGAAIRGRALGLEVAVVERLPSRRRSHHPDGGLLFAAPDICTMEERGAAFHLREIDLAIPATAVRDRLRHFVFMGPGGLATRRSRGARVVFPSVSKDKLVELLSVRASEMGASIAYNTRAARIEEDGAASAVVVDGGTRIKGKVVVSAEGCTGRLAARAGVPVNEFPAAWSYAVAADLPPTGKPVDEAGFMLGPVAGLPDSVPYLSFWAAGAGLTEVASGPLQKDRKRILDVPIERCLAALVDSDDRVAGRLGCRVSVPPAAKLDGCRVFARRLPRTAVGNRLIAVGDAITMCGMITNLAAVRTGDIAAEVASAAIARGDTSAAGLKEFDGRAFGLSMVKGMGFMHNLLIAAPMELQAPDLTRLFGMLGHLDMGALMGGGGGAAWAMTRFLARNAFAMMRRPRLGRYLRV